MSLTLKHHGIKGQKWGVRRFQNPDGSWTAAGAQRYGAGGNGGQKKSFGGSGSSSNKSDRVKSYLDGSWKDRLYKQNDDNNKKILEKEAKRAKNRKNKEGFGRAAEKEILAEEERHRKALWDESIKQARDLFEDKELRADLDKAKKAYDKFMREDYYDEADEIAYMNATHDIGKKIVDKYMSNLSEEEYKEYSAYGESKVYSIIDSYDMLFNPKKEKSK